MIYLKKHRVNLGHYLKYLYMYMDKPLKTLISRCGGKSLLADRIISIMPEHNIYIEPFVGGGSIYFKNH